ncbi:transmembrane protein, putative (macronuclear) [Tetrahymena thermophila SB210]|uniref:Transmembrane protein, putative n=1 Tax=Tetrahymena thermophila (strain SB210) TaxID=312017 RepID=W7X5A9_TETTS|nr:transmembrane protein, putative [Tetrahymena thermophila SB210]EWS71548.1 transmembrane protein, putative [Tetrahymena thermophila SB210]|eukprot:XP_012655910.1 transmembrane protein, putative [Tetrahymena thermophila SB210]
MNITSTRLLPLLKKVERTDFSGALLYEILQSLSYFGSSSLSIYLPCLQILITLGIVQIKIKSYTIKIEHTIAYRQLHLIFQMIKKTITLGIIMQQIKFIERVKNKFDCLQENLIRRVIELSQQIPLEIPYIQRFIIQQ